MTGGRDAEPPAGQPPGYRSALARPYSWTEGRTQPAVPIAIEARVEATAAGLALPEQRTDPMWTVVQLCAEPRSVAEIAALVAVPLGVAKVLVADLLHAGLVVVQATLGEDTSVDERRQLIERVLSGLRAQ